MYKSIIFVAGLIVLLCTRTPVICRMQEKHWQGLQLSADQYNHLIIFAQLYENFIGISTAVDIFFYLLTRLKPTIAFN
jgi:hypothetical protein